MERQESVVKEHQSRRHGADTVPRQVGKTIATVVRAFHSSEHGQTRSLQVAEQGRNRNNSHLECRQSTALLHVTSLPFEGCNLLFSLMQTLGQRFTLFFLTWGVSHAQRGLPTMAE
jgi:hypothetical protein